MSVWEFLLGLISTLALAIIVIGLYWLNSDSRSKDDEIKKLQTQLYKQCRKKEKARDKVKLKIIDKKKRG